MEKISNLYKSKFYVYEHYINGKVFYIGRGTGARAADLISRSNEWNNIVKNRMDKVKINIVAYFDTEYEASVYEIKQIKKMYKLGVKLVNVNHYNNIPLRHIFPEMYENYIPIIVPEEFMNTFLTKTKKDELCKTLNIIDSKGRLTKWNNIKNHLNKNGYNIRDTRQTIDDKSIRVSIIYCINSNQL